MRKEEILKVVQSQIYKTVGHASMCWTPERIFDDVEARKAGDNLYKIIGPIVEACYVVSDLTRHNTALPKG